MTAVAYKPDTRAPKSFGIGASEIAAIAGLNPYASPWDVWLRKTGQAPDESENEAMEWGHRLEPAIRQKYVDQTGAVVYVPPESLYHAEHAWARATPDGVVLGDHTPRTTIEKPLYWKHLLQCKNVGGWVERSWSDAPPIYVQLQEQWEMYVTGMARADVAALIGGNRFQVYTVHREQRLIDDLVTIASDFWRKVETRTAPPVDDSDACREHFESKYAKSNAVELVADGELEAVFRRWRRQTRAEKYLKKQIERSRNLVRKALAEAQADRITSSHGMATLVRSEATETAETDWKLIAQLLGSTKCSPEEWKALTESNTTKSTTAEKATLYAPRNWGKDKA